MNVSASTLDIRSLVAPFVVEHKLSCKCRGQQEADYRGAVLNSRGVNEAIKPFQSQGLALDLFL